MAEGSTCRNIKWLGELDIAHRGLFDRMAGREENTLSAILEAAERGIAVEVDVRLTKDGKVVIFHDLTLDRLTGGTGAIENFTENELEGFPTSLNGEKIPLLQTALSCLTGRVPLYIEVKSARNYDPTRLCEALSVTLEDYNGEVCIMSFDPRIVLWFSQNAPHIVRGLVIEDKTLKSLALRTFLRLAIRKTRPDFLSVDIDSLPHPYFTRWRQLGGKLITWTVQTEEQVSLGRAHTDALTFELPAVLG